MARRVAEDFPEGGTVSLGVGSTIELVAQALINHQSLRILTNNLGVASALIATMKNNNRRLKPDDPFTLLVQPTAPVQTQHIYPANVIIIHQVIREGAVTPVKVVH